MAGHEDTILRVAPPPTAKLLWHQVHLMRREHAVQPFLAPIAPLVPRTLMVDFTHQVVDRDYMLQTCLPGEPWSAIEDDLTPEEDAALWRGLARIAKAIHAVRGEAFGFPHPGPRFPRWIMTVIDMLGRIVADTRGVVLDAGDMGVVLDAGDMGVVLDAARANAGALDEIAEPRLLHGDLWGSNITPRWSN